jgi:hypothetical protein
MERYIIMILGMSYLMYTLKTEKMGKLKRRDNLFRFLVGTTLLRILIMPIKGLTSIMKSNFKLRLTISLN